MPRKFWQKSEYRIKHKKPPPDGFLKKHRKKLLLVFAMIVAAGLIYILIYSPIFRINKIIVIGTNSAESINQVRLLAKQGMSQKKWLVTTKDNFFIFQPKELDQLIRNNLAVDYLRVEKRWLNNLKIEINEKLPQILWADKDYLYYVDKDGIVMKALAPDKVEYDLPKVSRGTTTPVIIGKQIIAPNDINFIRQAADKIESEFKNLSIREIVALSLENAELYFYTSESWYLILNTEISIDRQLDNLKRLLDQKIEDRRKLEYVDLRIEDKLFYK